MSSLHRKITERLTQEPFSVSWIARDYRSEVTIGADEDSANVFAGGSKLLLLVTSLAAASAEQLDLEKRLTYESRHQKAAKSGILRWLQPPIELTLRDALAQMVVSSDSVGLDLVTESLSDQSGRPWGDTVSGLADELGLRTLVPPTSVSPDITIAPREMLTLVEVLESSSTRNSEGNSLITRSYADLGLQLLKSSRASGISAELPGYGPNLTESANLFCDGGEGGRASSTWSDAGIVYQSGRPAYGLAISCRGIPSEIDGLPGPYRARKVMAEVSSLIW